MLLPPVKDAQTIAKHLDEGNDQESSSEGESDASLGVTGMRGSSSSSDQEPDVVAMETEGSSTKARDGPSAPATRGGEDREAEEV